MTITIRRAQPQDAVVAVPLIIEANGDIADRLTGETTPTAVEQAFITLFQREDNRFSYLYSYVAVETSTQQILAVLVAYNGAEVVALDANLTQWLRNKNDPLAVVETEAHKDEYYVDILCVQPTARGKGIGTKLLQYAEQLTIQQGFHKLALNVEPAKDKAIKLYTSLGFAMTETWFIINEPYYHLVKTV